MNDFFIWMKNNISFSRYLDFCVKLQFLWHHHGYYWYKTKPNRTTTENFDICFRIFDRYYWKIISGGETGD